MRVLLLGLGNAPPRFHFASIHCENYLKKNTEGHEIITFGYNNGVDIRINTEDDFEKVVEKLPHGWVPDCCILWEVDWNLLPKGIENAPFPTVAIPWDWDYDVPLSKNCAEFTDLLIAFGNFEQEALQTMTDSKVEKFYSVGIMEKYFSPHPKKIKDRKYDILYTTGISDTEKLDRSKWILKLCKLSGKYHVNIDEHSPDFDGYIDLLRDSKLVLSHHRYGSMSGRILDAGAQGTVTLETGSEVEKHFVPDKEYIPVNDENIFEQIDKYLGNQELLQEMSDRVYSKVIREYEARRRFVRFLEFLDKTLKNRKSLKKVNTFTEYEKHIRRGEIYFYSFFRATSYFIVNSGNKLIESSIEEFKKAVHIEPTPQAMTNLAIAQSTYDLLNNRKDFLKDRAQADIDLFKKVVASHPFYVMAYYNLGLFQMRINDYKSARNTFSLAVKLFKDNKCQLDPWCLHNRDFDLFNNLLRKSHNHNLLLFCKGEKVKAIKHIKNLYHAATLFFISLIDENEGAINKALESLLEAHSLYPESGLIAMNAAKRLYLLGYREESLNMYEKAISLLPLQIDLRIEYIKILHSYHMNADAMNELENAIKITSRISMLKEKTITLETLKEWYTSSGYSYNPGNERFLNDVAKLLYTFLKKDPQNLTLISRIIDIWYELGRIDKMFEVVEYFISNYSDKTKINNTNRDRLVEIYKKLQQAYCARQNTLQKKRNNLEIIINTFNKTHETNLNPSTNKLVSVIVPTYNRPDTLKRALESIAAQTYKYVEAIVVNDAGQDVSNVINTFRNRLTIKYIAHDVNKDRAAARNTAIRHASGQYIAYLDDDDIFYPDHIETALKILTNTNYKVVYTDAYRAHQIKCGETYRAIRKDIPYSIDYVKGIFYTTNITPILCVVHDRSCFNEVGMFDESLPVLEDWDLWIRMSEKYDFYHIKQATCEFSWRVDGTSTTSSKPDEFARVRELIYKKNYKRFLETGIQISTCPRKPVSIIILTWNALEYTKKCIDSIRHHTNYPHEIIFVDNASTDGTVEYLRKLVKEYPNYKLIENQVNKGFAAGNNQGAAIASGEYVMLMNNDVLVPDGWLEGLVASLERDEKIGMVGPITNSISGRQMVRDVPYTDENGFHVFAQRVRKIYNGQLTPRYRIAGFAVLMRKALYEEVGGLDESFGTGNYEDDDLCLKVREKGYAIMVDESVFIHHYRSQTFIENKIDYRNSLSVNESRFREKWPNVDYEQLLELHDNLIDTNIALVTQGQQALELGNIDKAIELYSKVLKTNPIDEAALYGIGLAYQTSGKMDDAIDAYKKAIKTRSYFYRQSPSEDGSYLLNAYYNLALIYANTNQIDNAISTLNKAIELHNGDASAYNNLGVLYFKKNMHNDAKICFEKALSIDVNYHEAQQNLKKLQKNPSHGNV